MVQSKLQKEITSVIEKKKRMLLEKFPKIIFKDEKSTTIIPLVKCKLYLKHHRPIREGVCALRYHKQVWIAKELEKLIKAGIIKPSRSSHTATPVIIDKKDGTWCLAIDYQKVNKTTEDFFYSLPKIVEIFDYFTEA